MLKLKNIDKEYKDFSVNNINLKINEGEYLVILGPTGTGKTVILEMIAGLIKADKGSIIHKDENITDYSPENRSMAMVYQDYMLFPHLNVRKNIIFGLNIDGNYKKEFINNKLKEMVELFGISHLINRDVNTLSGGEKQRVALARALITSPEVLLLDEPLSALDPGTKETLIDELKNIHKKLGTTTLHVTHNFVEALALADRIAIMNNGEIEQIGDSEEVFQKPSSNFVAEFVGSKNIFEAKRIGDKIVIEGKNKSLEIEMVERIDEKSNITIRPEDIIISPEPLYSSARNSFSGKIIKIKDRLNYLEIIVDVGIEFSVHITRESFKKFNLKKDKEVYLSFKASAINSY
ncbi:MAG: ATP-binding cassette domain-containing protein [Bacillota bacterium]